MSGGIDFPPRLNDLDKGSSGQAGLSLGLSGLRVFEDPPGLHDKVRSLKGIDSTTVHKISSIARLFQVEYLLREWVRLFHQPAAGKESEKAFSSFVAMVGNLFQKM